MKVNSMKIFYALLISTTGFLAASDDIKVVNKTPYTRFVAIVYTTDNHTKIVPQGKEPEYKKLASGGSKEATTLLKRLPRKIGLDRDLLAGPETSETLEIFRGNNPISRRIRFINVGTLQNVNEVEIKKTDADVADIVKVK